MEQKPDKRMEALEAAITQMHQMIVETVASGKQEGRDEQLVEAVTRGIEAGMNQIAEAMLTPKRVIKGANNEIIGIEPVRN